MRPIFDAAKRASSQTLKRLAFAEGEHPYVLQCAQQLVTEHIARPLLIGRRESIVNMLPHLGLRMRPERDFDLFDPETDTRAVMMAEEYHRLVERRGVSPSHARRVVRNGSTVIAGLLLRRGDADAMICGAVGRYLTQLRHVSQVIGKADQARGFAALSALILPTGPLFIADTYVSYDPDAERLAEITMLAADEVRRFGLEPKVALLSHSNFGNEDTPSAMKMRDVLALLNARAPELEVEGEMHADAALSDAIRKGVMPDSRLTSQANLLVMPDLSSANIAFQIVRVFGDALPVGPILPRTLGMVVSQATSSSTPLGCWLPSSRRITPPHLAISAAWKAARSCGVAG